MFTPTVLQFMVLRRLLFCVEIVCATHIFFHFFPKRSHFCLRFLLGLLIQLGISVGLGYASYHIWIMNSHHHLTAIGNLCSACFYLIAFLASLCSVLLCYRIHLTQLFFYGVTAYCLQHFTFNSYLLIVNLINPDYSIYSKGTINALVVLPYLIFTLLMYVGFGFLLFRKRNLYSEYQRTGIALLFGTVLILNIGISTIVESFSTEHRILYLCSIGTQIFSMILILSVEKLLLEKFHLAQDKAIIEHLMEQGEKQYKFAEANAELLAIKAHDLKHQVTALRAGGDQAEQVLKELEKITGDYDGIAKTDNDIINIILSEKWLYCQKQNIKLSCTVSPHALDFMEKTDLYSLIGNILDNCIEAVMRVENPEQRSISFSVLERSGVTTVTTNNFFIGKLNIVDGLPITTKENKLDHGFGVRSIQMITLKYKGVLHISVEDNIFIAQITFTK